MKTCCDRCYNGTYRKPDKNGKVLCAKCNERVQEIRSIIKDYLIELGLIK